MEIPVSCTCGKSFKAKATLAGKTVACPGCKSPITIPATANPAPAPPLAPQPPMQAPATGAEILMSCACGQQFKVDSQFAGQQVNCPACQTLCVIPAAQAPSAFSAAMPPQPPAPQPMMQQPMMPQQPAYPPAGGMGMDYQQPNYGGASRRGNYKTALGIFIFAIAACVFAGGFGFFRLAEAITQLRIISSQISSSSRSNVDERGFPIPPTRSAMQTNRQIAEFLTSMTTILIKLGTIAMMLGIIAIIVAAVFCIMSPPPLMALGITEVCVASVAAALLIIFQYLPILQDNVVIQIGLSDFANVLMGLLVKFTEIGTFIMFSIFMMYALSGKNRRSLNSDQPKYALIAFSISAGIILLIAILSLANLQNSGKWAVYFLMFVTWLAHAAMIVGFVFLIKTCFESKGVIK